MLLLVIYSYTASRARQRLRIHPDRTFWNFSLNKEYGIYFLRAAFFFLFLVPCELALGWLIYTSLENPLFFDLFLEIVFVINYYRELHYYILFFLFFFSELSIFVMLFKDPVYGFFHRSFVSLLKSKEKILASQGRQRLCLLDVYIRKNQKFLLRAPLSLPRELKWQFKVISSNPKRKAVGEMMVLYSILQMGVQFKSFLYDEVKELKKKMEQYIRVNIQAPEQESIYNLLQGDETVDVRSERLPDPGDPGVYLNETFADTKGIEQQRELFLAGLILTLKRKFDKGLYLHIMDFFEFLYYHYFDVSIPKNISARSYPFRFIHLFENQVAELFQEISTFFERNSRLSNHYPEVSFYCSALFSQYRASVDNSFQKGMKA
jgi:hypothetical protein